MSTCLRLAPVGAPEDTDTSSDAAGEDDDLAWYEEREFDSIYFPLGMLRPMWQASPDSSSSDSDASHDDGFPRRGYPEQRHCWDDADWSDVKVRSASYLETQLKEPSDSPMLELVHADLFAAPHGATYATSSRSAVPRLREKGDDRFLFVLHFRLPSAHFAATWAAPKATPWAAGPSGALFQRFCSGMGDEERSGRMKLLPSVVDGPWMVKSAVGNRPVIIGRQCPTTYLLHDRCLEASVDCTSAGFGRKLSKLLTGGDCTLALYVILEGKAEEELPEQILGGVRVCRGSLK